VPEITLASRSGLEHLIAAGTLSPGAGVTVSLRTGLALASVIARKDREDEIARRVREALALDLPLAPRRVGTESMSFAWAGPGQWLVIAEGAAGHALEAQLRRELGGFASVSDQSDGRVVIRVGGPNARDALAKGLPVDLHPRAFGPDQTAITGIAYIGVHFWQVEAAAPTYEFAVSRSFAAAFWSWLMSAAAEFGVAVGGWQ
jgi:sarcosine oxidase subunit gamma